MIGGKAKESDRVGANEERESRMPYHAPAIVYEGQIDIRAGSPFFTEDDLGRGTGSDNW